MFEYIRDPQAIYQASFATIRAETDLSALPPNLHPPVLRMIHACGDPSIAADVAYGGDPATAVSAALVSGRPVLVDSEMVANGIIRRRLGASPLICALNDPQTPDMAKAIDSTRSAGAVELWRPHLAGAVVVIGNAPTALFRLLEIMRDEPTTLRPAAILGFSVGFIGAAESKEALVQHHQGVPFLTLRGRRGGSAIAAGAFNALADPEKAEA